jgi:hypothetical protein
VGVPSCVRDNGRCVRFIFIALSQEDRDNVVTTLVISDCNFIGTCR